MRLKDFTITKFIIFSLAGNRVSLEQMFEFSEIFSVDIREWRKWMSLERV